MINDCLCIQNTTNVVPTSTATCLNVIASACDVLTTTCPVGPYSLADLNSGIISVAWTASDTMLLGQNWTVNIQTVPDSPSECSLEIHITRIVRTGGMGRLPEFLAINF